MLPFENVYLNVITITLICVFIQVTIGYLIDQIPAEQFTFYKGFYKEKKFEPMLYRILMVKKWKKYLPDGAAAKKKGFRKKHLRQMNKAYYKTFIQELCRAEFSHWLQLFVLIMVFIPWSIFPYMVVYAIVVNVPCILAQRYNRPRFIQIYERLKDV